MVEGTFEAFLGSHPRALKFVQDIRAVPLSFATESLCGNNAFRFINVAKAPVKFRLPVQRRAVELGVITLRSVAPDSAAACISNLLEGD